MTANRTLRRQGSYLQRWKSSTWLGKDYSLAFFIVLLILVLFTGGSSRWDAVSLMLLRPIAMLFFLHALFSLKIEHWQKNRSGLVFAGAIMLLPAIQLIPLPPELWSGFAGRHIVREVDLASGVGDVWRPISLVPLKALNALFALTIPGAVLLMALRLKPDHCRRLPAIVLGLIIGSATLGLLQITGPEGGQLYLYEHTHADSAVGFLANRNHEAALLACAFPILAVVTTDPRTTDRFYGRPIFAVTLAAFLLPLIMITGSRTGIMVTSISLLASLWLLRLGRRTTKKGADSRNWILARIIVLLPLAVGALTLLLGRDEAVGRVVAWDPDADFRLKAWREVAAFASKFWPVGSGMGTFVEAYRLFDPKELMDFTHLNQAHNDWLELVLTGGLPALTMLGFTIVAILWRAWKIFAIHEETPEQRQLSRLGIVIIVVLALASVTDYPLRTPIMGALFTIAVVWAFPPNSSASAKSN